MATPLWIIAVLFALAGFVAVAVGIVGLILKKREFLIVFVVGVIAAMILPITLMFAYFDSPEDENVRVKTLSGNAMNLRFPHRFTYYDGKQYAFTSKQKWSEIAARIKTQFPETLQLSSDVLVVLGDDIAVSVTKSSENNHYTAETLTQTLWSSNGDATKEYVFPTYLAPELHLEVNRAVRASFTMEELAEFYSHFPSAKIRDDEIVTPAVQGRPVVLRFAGEFLTAHWD